MSSLSICDELDQAIDRMIAAPEEKPAKDLRPGLAGLLEIADDLRHLPRANFKTRLRVELEWQAAGRTVSSSHATEQASDAALLPTLFGRGYEIYPVRRAHLAASAALHAAMVIAVIAAVVLMRNAPRPAQQAFLETTVVRPWVSPAGDHHGGDGGGGKAQKTDASKGALPPRDTQQFSRPVVVVKIVPAKLPIQATIVGTPDLTLPKTQIGDPLSGLLVPSDGRGTRGGIGQGHGGGTGDDIDDGFGPLGKGADFIAGNGVTSPVAIFTPEPEYSDEARKVKFSGTVWLRAVIGRDGRPRGIRVERSLGMGLDEKAIAAVSTWRFRPGMKDGQPVPVQVSVEVNFHLF